MKLLRKTSYLIPLFCFTCFLACQKESSKGDNTDLFNTTDVLEIPIDENISAIGNYYSYFDDKRNVLVIPSVRNELYYFDIDQNKIVKKIKLEEEGPNGVGSVLKINIIEDNKIFVNSTRSLANYIVDSTGTKISTFSMKGNKDLDSRGIIAMPRTSLSRYKQNIIAYPDINTFTDPKTGRRYYNLETKVFANLDMNTSIYTMLPIQFPEKMRGRKGFWDTFHFTPSYDLMGDVLYYTFPGCDSLYAYDLNKKQFKRVLAQSIHESNKSNIFDKQYETLEGMYSTYALNCSYFKVLVDKYNHKIYRIIGHPTENWKNSGNVNDVAISKPCSIQVFDSTTLKFLGETEIYPQNSFDFLDSFVGKRGLYISNNHPQNVKANEENLSYTIFTLKK